MSPLATIPNQTRGPTSPGASSPFLIFVLGVLASVAILFLTNVYRGLAGLPALLGFLWWVHDWEQTFRKNLFLTVLLGTLVSAWILYFTDWFPAIGGLLALGGIFSWLAFVSKLLPEGRLTELQTWADKRIFDSQAATLWFFAFLGAGYVAIQFFGAIQVKAIEETAERVVYLGNVGSIQEREGVRVSAEDDVRQLFPTRWWAPTKVRVRAKGYPDKVVEVHPLALTKLSVPSSFLRPVVLLRPTPDLIAQRQGLKIKVRINDKDYGPIDFTGHSIWIGCDDQVEIPALQESLWRVELQALKREPLLRFWLNPKEFTGQPVPQAGDRVTVTVLDGDKNYGAPVTFSIRAVSRFQDFPQIEILDAPKGETEVEK